LPVATCKGIGCTWAAPCPPARQLQTQRRQTSFLFAGLRSSHPHRPAALRHAPLNSWCEERISARNNDPSNRFSLQKRPHRIPMGPRRLVALPGEFLPPVRPRAVRLRGRRRHACSHCPGARSRLSDLRSRASPMTDLPACRRHSARGLRTGAPSAKIEISRHTSAGREALTCDLVRPMIL